MPELLYGCIEMFPGAISLQTYLLPLASEYIPYVFGYGVSGHGWYGCSHHCSLVLFGHRIDAFLGCRSQVVVLSSYQFIELNSSLEGPWTGLDEVDESTSLLCLSLISSCAFKTFAGETVVPVTASTAVIIIIKQANNHLIQMSTSKAWHCWCDHWMITEQDI